MSERTDTQPAQFRQFKNTTVFDWDLEPMDERPSEFAGSTGYSVLSSFATLSGPDTLTPQHRVAQRGNGAGSSWLMLGLVVALAVGGLLGLARLLTGP